MSVCKKFKAYTELYIECGECSKMADGSADLQNSSTMNEQPEDPKPINPTVENLNNEVKEQDIPPICSPTVSKPILAQSHFGSPYSVPGVAVRKTSPVGNLNNSAFGISPKLKNNLFPNKESPIKPSKMVLKPATLSAFTLRPSSLTPSTSVAKPPEEKEDTTPKTDSASEMNSKNSCATSNGDGLKFVPLIHELKTDNEKNLNIPVTQAASVQPIQTNFVFGQNLEERVIADECRPSTSCGNSNGTSDLQFGSALKENSSADNGNATPSKDGKSLSESAREYEESRAVKRKYEEVEVITGEEGETNVCHISCKLFSYDSTSLSWQERGRGNLRLNDLEVTEDNHSFRQSRLVFRTSGSLRVLMNTKIWANMMVQKAGPKSIRLTAMDSNGEIKVFLIMASIDDTERLYRLLQDRVKSEQSSSKNKKPNLEESPTKEEISAEVQAN